MAVFKYLTGARMEECVLHHMRREDEGQRMNFRKLGFSSM